MSRCRRSRLPRRLTPECRATKLVERREFDGQRDALEVEGSLRLSMIPRGTPVVPVEIGIRDDRRRAPGLHLLRGLSA